MDHGWHEKERRNISLRGLGVLNGLSTWARSPAHRLAQSHLCAKFWTGAGEITTTTVR